MGSPSPFQLSGSAIAGLPVQLKIGVNGMNASSRSKNTSASSSAKRWPCGGGAVPSVGVSQMS